MNHPSSSITDLRGIGPKVFLSYSFKDQIHANILAGYLQAKGFQVRMEDETSLVGHRLAEELPRRIGDAECFIPIITTTSENSYWVREEFNYAEQWSKQVRFLIAPILLSSNGSASWLSDFAFIDAKTEGLSPIVLDSIRKVLLTTVRRIQIIDNDPLMVLQDDAEHLFASESLGRRVIFDSTGYWFRMIDSLISWAKKSDTGLGGKTEQFIKQEFESRQMFQWMFSIIDHVLFALAREVANKRSQGIVDEKHVSLVLQFFYRIVFAKFLFDDFQMVMPGGIVSVGESSQRDFEKIKEIAQEGTNGGQGFGFFMERSKLNKAIGWALDQVLAHTDLRDYDTRRRPLIGLNLSLGKHKYGGVRGARSNFHIQVPKLVVPYLLGTEALPHPTVKRWGWTLFALPQIAIEAMELGAAYKGAGEHVIAEAIRNGIGWEVGDYDRIVLSE